MKSNRRDFLAAAGTIALAAAALPVKKTVSRAEQKKYKACVIGDTKQGGYGHSLHLAWSNRPDVAVAALADPDEEGRAKHAAEAGAQRTYADYREMLEKEKPDLVSVGPRWTVHHKDYLMACVEAGAHGYMEKPISTDLVEADAMVEAVRSKNLKWALAHQKRMMPVVQQTKKLVFEEGLVGDVLEARGRGKEDHRAGGEDLIVLGTHIFDLMLFFFGKPQWCSANITVGGKPARKGDVHPAGEPLGPVVGDRIFSAFGFEGGAPGFFSTMRNRHGNGGRWGLDIYGSRGIVKIRMEVYPEISYVESSSWMPENGESDWKPLPGSQEGAPKGEDPSVVMNSYVVDDLIASIEGDREPQVSLASGRDSYEMIQAVYAAHIIGGRIDLPLEERRHPLEVWS